MNYFNKHNCKQWLLKLAVDFCFHWKTHFPCVSNSTLVCNLRTSVLPLLSKWPFLNLCQKSQKFHWITSWSSAFAHAFFTQGGNVQLTIKVIWKENIEKLCLKYLTSDYFTRWTSSSPKGIWVHLPEGSGTNERSCYWSFAARVGIASECIMSWEMNYKSCNLTFLINQTKMKTWM